MTELVSNKLTFFAFGTLLQPVRMVVPTSGSRPYDLTSDAARNIWFTEQIGGRLGKLQSGSEEIVEFAISANLDGILLQGVDVDALGNVWLAGLMPNRIFLPIVSKD